MMSFEGRIITVAGLLEMELPGRTVRLSDGGVVWWGGNKFESRDEEFGVIESVESLGSGSGETVVGGSFTLLPASTAAAATLSHPSYQNSPIRAWLAVVDPATAQVVGTPELLGNLLLDTTELRLSLRTRKLEIGYITASERLFSVNEGNVLSPRFHKSVWPGETGLDNATGIGLSVAWGVESPPRQYNRSGSGGGGTGGASGTAASFGGSSSGSGRVERGAVYD